MLERGMSKARLNYKTKKTIHRTSYIFFLEPTKLKVDHGIMPMHCSNSLGSRNLVLGSGSCYNL